MAHDAHNLVIAGANPADMPRVACQLEAHGDQPRVEHYNARGLEWGMNPGTRSPLLSLAGIALPVVPAVKITNLGLVHVNRQEFIPLFPAA